MLFFTALHATRIVSRYVATKETEPRPGTLH